MKKRSLLLASIFTLGGYAGFAQEENKKEEVQEIIIKKKGEKDATLKVEFNNGNVTVNGKPLIEFNNGGDITINKKKIVIGRNFGNVDEMLQQFEEQFGGDGNNMMREFQFRFNDGERDNDMMEMNIRRPFLGVSTEKGEAGAIITDISAESAAEKAGLKKGDIITEIDDTKITDPIVLSETIRSKKPEQEITVKYLRDKKKKEVKLKLKENKSMQNFNFPPTPPVPPTPPLPPGVNEDMDIRIMPAPGRELRPFSWNNKDDDHKLGIQVKDMPDTKGVKIVDIEEGSAAEISGLKKDDIITDINNKIIDNTDAARMALYDNKKVSSYPVKILRNGVAQTITIQFPKKIKTIDL